MDERVRFISKLLEGERMAELCREFGISRKTGYKFWHRYVKEGIHALGDGSHRPGYCPHRTPEATEALIVELRKSKPTWGPKKLKTRLTEIHEGVSFPAASTIGDIIEKHGLVTRKRRFRKKVYHPTDRRETSSPNQVWCVDFKGQFKLRNGKYCYPLTVTDHFSRYLLCCEALEDTRCDPVIMAFERIFEEYGLPEAIRSDNGAPFAARGPLGLSRLSAWWMRHGIQLERIEPGHPQQNGRHERFHLTMKQEVTRPASPNFLHQQERFDTFVDEYNEVRPHEALDMRKPAQLYVKSARSFSSPQTELDYPMHDHTCRVYSDGNIRIGAKRFYVSSALQNENVGIREVCGEHWLVTYVDRDVGYLDLKSMRLIDKHPCASEGYKM